MRYQALSVRCECGRLPLRITEIGFTSDHQLVIHWWCSECKKMVYALKPLAECWKQCPAQDTLETMLVKADVRQSFDDSRFLRSLGVQPLDAEP
jgi:hypothetical protein